MLLIYFIITFFVFPIFSFGTCESRRRITHKIENIEKKFDHLSSFLRFSSDLSRCHSKTHWSSSGTLDDGLLASSFSNCNLFCNHLMFHSFRTFETCETNRTSKHRKIGKNKEKTSFYDRTLRKCLVVCSIFCCCLITWFLCG